MPQNHGAGPTVTGELDGDKSPAAVVSLKRLQHIGRLRLSACVSATPIEGQVPWLFQIEQGLIGKRSPLSFTRSHATLIMLHRDRQTIGYQTGLYGDGVYIRAGPIGTEVHSNRILRLHSESCRCAICRWPTHGYFPARDY